LAVIVILCVGGLAPVSGAVIFCLTAEQIFLKKIFRQADKTRGFFAKDVHLAFEMLFFN
jgi:hypothetical protein